MKKLDSRVVVNNNTTQLNSSTFKLSILISYLDNCRANNKILILDCCHALTGIIDWRPPQSESIRILAASGQFEKAKEVIEFKASFLAYSISRALTSNAVDLVNSQNSISINALFEWLKKQALEYNSLHSDTVSIPKLIGDQGNDIEICKFSNPLTHYAVVDYLKNIVMCFSSCKKQCFGRYPWCRSAFEIGKNIGNYVIPNVKYSKNGSIDQATIETLFSEWHMSKNRKLIALLGDSGVGKSTACLFLSFELSKDCLRGDKEISIPIYISLESLSRSGLIGKELALILRDHLHIEAPDEVIYSLIENQSLVFFLDGFDEISDRSNHSMILRNLKLLEPIFHSRCQVILTCRTHFFVNQEQVNNVLLGNSQSGTELYSTIKEENTNFEVIELQEFTKKEIFQFISNVYAEEASSVWNEIKSIYNLQDLSKRPILLILILKTLQTLHKSKEKINRADIYSAYVEFWFKREAERIDSDIDLKLKYSFIEEISVEMWRNNLVSIHHKDLKEEIQKKYAEEIRSFRDIQTIDYDTRNSSFLNRDQNGFYKFMHKSFQEFFVAKHSINEIRADGIGMYTWQVQWFDKEVAAFLADLIQSKNHNRKIQSLSQVSTKNVKRIMLWNVLHILSLVEPSNFETFTDNNILEKINNRANKEQEAVILRQYCRIIAKFDSQDKARKLINKIVQIVSVNPIQNVDNNSTYTNYYYGVSSACDALLSHLDTTNPKYDQELHIYVLGEIGNSSHVEQMKTIMKRWKDRSQLENAHTSINKIKQRNS